MKSRRSYIALMALLVLGGCTPQEKRVHPFPLVGDKLSPTEQARLTKQAEAGNADAAFRLYLYHGDYTPDSDESLKWLRLAAEAGDTRAQHGYGLYLQMSERQQDQEEAMKWLERAAQNGSRSSMFELASAYESGEKIPVNFSKAKAWYETAALNGGASEMIKVAEFLYQGKGCPRDPVSAYVWARLAETRLPKGSISNGTAQKLREEIQKNLASVDLKTGRQMFSTLQKKIPLEK